MNAACRSSLLAQCDAARRGAARHGTSLSAEIPAALHVRRVVPQCARRERQAAPARAEEGAGRNAQRTMRCTLRAVSSCATCRIRHGGSHVACERERAYVRHGAARRRRTEGLGSVVDFGWTVLENRTENVIYVFNKDESIRCALLRFVLGVDGAELAAFSLEAAGVLAALRQRTTCSV